MQMKRLLTLDYKGTGDKCFCISTMEWLIEWTENKEHLFVTVVQRLLLSKKKIQLKIRSQKKNRQKTAIETDAVKVQKLRPPL